MAAPIDLRNDQRLTAAPRQRAQSRRLLALAEVYDGGSRTDASRKILTRKGFPFWAPGCDSRLAKEIRHVSMHCSSGDYATTRKTSWPSSFAKHSRRSPPSSPHTPMGQARPRAPRDQRTEWAYDSIELGGVWPSISREARSRQVRRQLNPIWQFMRDNCNRIFKSTKTSSRRRCQRPGRTGFNDREGADGLDVIQAGEGDSHVSMHCSSGRLRQH